MRQMVDYSTNIIQSYDGTLNSNIPGPLALFDESRQRSQPLFIQSLDADFFIDTRAVGTLLFHMGNNLKFVLYE